MKKILALILTAIMALSLVSVAFADEFGSPAGEMKHTIKVIVKGNSGGTASANVVSAQDGENVTIKANPDKGYSFGNWTFSGEFEWVSGDANSAEIVIRPLGDVEFEAVFNGSEGPKKDNGGESPTTGYTDIVIAILAASVVCSAAAVVYTGKKYFEA